MAYINVDEFKRKLIDEKNFFPAIVARALDEMPTADVVPREEVERLLEDFQRSIRADAKVGMSAGEILMHIHNMLAELKKKYIGDKR